jgi:threonine/homoserine/homoserine lactone efflux protein
MTDPIAFVLGCLALLATPGPTNTLLATSGAAAGFMRSTPLMLAEIAGYAVSIFALSLLIAPLLGESPAVSIALRLGCSAYLLWSAVHLWREGANTLASAEPVKFRRVFVTTMLNPKGIIFALVLIPHLGQRRFAEAAPYLLGLVAMIFVVASGWIATGALIGATAKGRVGAGVLRRAGAAVLALFGVLLSSSVLLPR